MDLVLFYSKVDSQVNKIYCMTENMAANIAAPPASGNNIPYETSGLNLEC